MMRLNPLSRSHMWEGDGVGIIFRVHRDVEMLCQHVQNCRVAMLPSTRAVAKLVVAANFHGLLQADIDQKVESLLTEQLAKVEPGFTYFDAKRSELKDQLALFEAAQIFNPLIARDMTLTVPKVRSFATLI